MSILFDVTWSVTSPVSRQELQIFCRERPPEASSRWYFRNRLPGTSAASTAASQEANPIGFPECDGTPGSPVLLSSTSSGRRSSASRNSFRRCSCASLIRSSARRCQTSVWKKSARTASAHPRHSIRPRPQLRQFRQPLHADRPPHTCAGNRRMHRGTARRASGARHRKESPVKIVPAGPQPESPDHAFPGSSSTARRTLRRSPGCALRSPCGAHVPSVPESGEVDFSGR